MEAAKPNLSSHINEAKYLSDKPGAPLPNAELVSPKKIEEDCLLLCYLLIASQKKPTQPYR